MKHIRHLIAITALTMLMMGNAQAQIYTGENESNDRINTEDVPGVVPGNGLYIDQSNEPYTPLGEGWMVIAVLGGLYLIKKQKANKAQ